MPKASPRQTNKKQSSIRASVTDNSQKTIQHIITGGLVSSDFFYKHKLKIFVLLILVMFYISTKYQCMTGMETIQRLEKELEVVKTERIRESSRYMSRIRESSMAVIADSIRPGLCIQQQPPYILELKINDNQ